jgi:hypothetical protein
MLSGHLPLGYDSTPSDREGASVQQLAVHPTKAVKPAFPQATTAVEKFPELKAVRIALTCADLGSPRVRILWPKLRGVSRHSERVFLWNRLRAHQLEG